MFKLMPTKWYYPTACSGPVPCEWSGWVDLGLAGVQWITVALMSSTEPAPSPRPAE